MGTVNLGLDLGQKQDYSAMAAGLLVGGDEWEVPYLARLPLGLSYPEVAREALRVCRQIEARGHTVSLVVDATGVGQPVVDLLLEVNDRYPVTAVYLAPGERLRPLPARTPSYRVGKAYLVGRLKTLLQAGRLRIGRTAWTEALVEELMAYEVRVTDKGSEQYGAMSTGAHDDLATALGLAVLLQSSWIGWVDILSQRLSDCPVCGQHTYLTLPSGEQVCSQCGYGARESETWRIG